jgi:DNA-binding winged helix-turn-helix (wHTH) protein
MPTRWWSLKRFRSSYQERAFYVTDQKSRYQRAGLSAHPLEAITFGQFRLFPTQRLLEKAGRAVHMGGRALDILIVLAKRAGEIVSKRDLLATVWADVKVDEGSLRFHMAALRKTLGDGQSGARYIINVPGRGYCLVAAVSCEGPLTPPPVEVTAAWRHAVLCPRCGSNVNLKKNSFGSPGHEYVLMPASYPNYRADSDLENP